MKEYTFLLNPYKKHTKTKVQNHVTLHGTNYFTTEEDIVFPGTEKIIGDIFYIDGVQTKAVYDNGTIFYYGVEGGINVSVEIDYDRRLDIIQQVGGLFILKAAVQSLCGIKTIDYKVGPNSSKIILDREISKLELEKVEEYVNHLILSDLEINSLEYSNLEERVSIGGLGKFIIEGPHVKRTGEIGLLKILPSKSETEIVFLCGKRAIRDYMEKSKIIGELEKNLGTRQKNLINTVNLLKNKTADTLAELKSFKENRNIETVMEYKEEAREINGVKYIFKFFNNMNFMELKNISERIVQSYNYVQIYGIAFGAKSQFLVSRSKNLNLDLKKIYSELEDEYKLFGSGNVLSVSGNCATEVLESLMQRFLILIKNELEKE